MDRNEVDQDKNKNTNKKLTWMSPSRKDKAGKHRTEHFPLRVDQEAAQDDCHHVAYTAGASECGRDPLTMLSGSGILTPLKNWLELKAC